MSIKINSDQVDLHSESFQIMAAANETLDRVEWRYSMDQVKKMANSASRVLICDNMGN